MKEKTKTMWAIILVLSALGIILCLAGCSKGNRYKVDLDGSDFCYEGVKESYRAGNDVTLYYTLIATDTDYSFYLDGEPINFEYDEKKGFVIRFTMPEHDVKLECNAKESMTYVLSGWNGEADVMLLDLYRAETAAEGSKESREYVITTIDDPDQVRLDVYVKEGGEEETCTSCSIPYENAHELLCFVYDNGLDAWNDLEEWVSLDGTQTVCKFWNGEEHIRVSTDRMPEGGEKTLDELFKLLEGCVQQ